VSDQHERLRSLPLPAVAAVLDLNLNRFRRTRNEYVGGCPVHGSKNNTNCFRYSDDGRFYCFSCGARGRGAIDLVKLVKNISFKAAVELLQPLVGQVPPETKKPPVEALPTKRSLRRRGVKDVERGLNLTLEIENYH